jgi:hypothetical protein
MQPSADTTDLSVGTAVWLIHYQFGSKQLLPLELILNVPISPSDPTMVM